MFRTETAGGDSNLPRSVLPVVYASLPGIAITPGEAWNLVRLDMFSPATLFPFSHQGHRDERNKYEQEGRHRGPGEEPLAGGTPD